MADTIRYFYMPVSPFTYLGHARLLAMAARHGVGIDHRVADFGRIFAASGGLPVWKRPPQRQAYRLVEIDRWRRALDMPMTVRPKYHPVDPEPASLLLAAAQAAGADEGRLAEALLTACWAGERDLADAATLGAICAESGLDGAALLTAAGQPAARAILDRNTEDAIAAGVFGAPTYLYRGEMFWGQDRLEFLDRALARWTR